jgi:IclR family transcriptional regulator, KDG regulon repressor
VLAARAGEPRLLALAQPMLRALVAEVGETSHLSVLDGGEVLTLLSEAPPSAIRATGHSGRVVAVSCTSSGRALLFDHDRAELDALLAVTGLARSGPNAPRSAAELWRRLERARELGYAAVEEEAEVDLVAVAAPVRDFRGRVVAAVNVSGPRFRLGTRLDRAGAAVAEAATSLSAALGHVADAGATAARRTAGSAR